MSYYTTKKRGHSLVLAESIFCIKTNIQETNHTFCMSVSYEQYSNHAANASVAG